MGGLKDGGAADDEKVKKEEEINGEGVRKEVVRLRGVEGVRALVAGLAWGVCVVGIWGDAWA